MSEMSSSHNISNQGFQRSKQNPIILGEISILKQATKRQSNKMIERNNIKPRENKTSKSQKKGIVQRMLQQEKYKRWNDEMKHFEKGLFRVHDKHIRYDPNSLYLLSYKTKLRKAIVWLIESKLFEFIIITSIIVNSITMALFDYQDRTSAHIYNQRLGKIQLGLTIIFTIEAALRIMGMGFILDHNSYLRDPWNWIDLFSLIAGWIEQLPYVPKLKYLRTLRVIRPLRGIKVIPSMRRMIRSLLYSLPMLGNVVLFLFFFFALFGTLGVSLFKGYFHNRCRLTPLPVNEIWEIDLTQDRICSTTSDQGYQCLQGTYCGNPDMVGYTLLNMSDDYDLLTYYGYMNFDNLGIAIITILQVITLEGWAVLMNKFSDSDASYLSPIYFLIVVFFGGFFLLNLILAVILDSFEVIDKQQRIQELQDHLKRLDYQTKKTALSKMRTKGSRRNTFAARKSKIQNLNSQEKHLSSNIEENSNENDIGDSSLFTEKYLVDENDDLHSSISSIESIKLNNSKDLLVNLKRQKSALEKLRRADNANLIDKQDISKQKSFDQGQQATPVIETLKSLQKSQNNIGQDGQTYQNFSQNREIEELFGKIEQLNTQERIYQNLCLDRYPITVHESTILDDINIACFVMFGIEMILKIIALGPMLYLRDKFNIFDCIIIMLSIVDITLKEVTNYNNSLLLVFRAARLLRIFKLAKQWRSLQNLMNKIGKSLKDIGNFSVLMFIFMFIYALLGMELYAERIKFNDQDQPINVDACNDEDGCVGLGKSPRLNFDNQINAMITIFVIIIGDDWNSTMFDYARASSSWTLIFFFSLIAFGHILLLNLFLAILLKDFDYKHDDQSKILLNQNQEQEKSFYVKLFEDLKEREGDTTALIMNQSEIKDDQDDDSGRLSQKIYTADQKRANYRNQKKNLKSLRDPYNKQHSINSKKNITQSINLKRSEMSVSNSKIKEELRMSYQSNIYPNIEPQNILFKKTLTEKQLQTQITLEGDSLYFLGKQNRFRNFVTKITRHKALDATFLVLILVSTIILALDQPLTDPNNSFNTRLDNVDLSLSIFFLFECVLKIISYGLLFNGKKSYLRDKWNVLDFSIVILSIISQVASDQFKIVKSIRLFRILRPLRILSKNEELKIAVQCLFYSIKDIMNVFIITFFVFTIYSIFGVNFFKGKFYECYTNHLPESLSSQLTNSFSFSKWHCISMGGEWINDRQNFNNIFYGLLSLFQMSTTDGWVQIMQNGIDSTAIDYTYDLNRNLWSSLYFIFFVIIGSQFMINLFVGVVINTFKFEKDKISLNFMLTDTQKEWIFVQINCLKLKPKEKEIKPQNKFRRLLYKVTKSKIFDISMQIFIVLNIVIFCCNWYLEPQIITNYLENINTSFTAVFTVEALIKIIAYDKQYFRDGWNIFDIIVIIGSYLQMFLDYVVGKSFGSHITFLRIFRLGRILRLIKKAKSLNNIFTSFISSIPSLANIGLLLFLLIYFYALLGINLFGKVKINDELDDHTNFQNFFNAFLTLVRCSTGEAWTDVMRAYMDQKSITNDCINDPSYQDMLQNGGEANGCGNYWLAIFFFWTYELIVTFIFLNLFIAIIIEAFKDTSEKQNLRVDEIILSQFLKQWQKYDPEGTGFIQCSDLKHLLIDIIKQNIQLMRGGEYLLKYQNEMNKFIAELQLPLYNNFKHYNFHDILNHLVKSLFKVDFDKAQMIRSESNFKQSNSQQSSKTSQPTQQNLILNSDQMEYSTFEDLLKNFYQTVKQNKIRLYEEFKNLRQNIDRRKHKYRDKYKEAYYDSRVIIYMPALIQKLKHFTELMKKKREKEGNTFLKVQAMEEIQRIKIMASPQREKLQSKIQKDSIFIALAQNAKVKEQNESLKLKSNSNNMDSQNTLSPFRAQQSTMKNNLNVSQRIQSTSYLQKILTNTSEQQITRNNIGQNTQNSHESLSRVEISKNERQSPVQQEELKKESEDGNNSIKSFQSNLSSSQTQSNLFQDFKKNQTALASKLSGLKSVIEDIQRGATTNSGLERIKQIENDVIMEEDQDCDSPQPYRRGRKKSGDIDQDIELLMKQKSKLDKNFQHSPNSPIKLIMITPTRILPEKIKSPQQSPVITVLQAQNSSKNSSSSTTPKNQGFVFSPKGNKKSSRLLLPETLLAKLRPEDIIDEEKSYEETQTQKNQSINCLLGRSLKFESQISKFDLRSSQEEEELKRNNTQRFKMRGKQIENSLLLGKQIYKYKMSSFAIEAIKKSSFNKIAHDAQQKQRKSLKNRTQDNSNSNKNASTDRKNMLISKELKEAEPSRMKSIDEDDLNEFINAEDYLASSVSIGEQQKLNDQQTENNIFDEYEKLDTEGHVLDLQMQTQTKLRETIQERQRFTLAVNQGNKKRSQITFGNLSNNLMGLRVDSQNDEHQLTNSNKKFSSNTTQLFLNSFQDIISLSKRSSNKLSSVRYQHMNDESKEDGDDDFQNSQNREKFVKNEIKFDKSIDQVDYKLQVNIQDTEDPKVLVENQIKTRDAKLRELLNIDIESSDISSDLYLDDEEKDQDKYKYSIKKEKKSKRKQESDYDNSISISEELSQMKTFRFKQHNYDSPLDKFDIDKFEIQRKLKNQQNKPLDDNILEEQRTIKPYKMETPNSSIQSPIQTDEEESKSNKQNNSKRIQQKNRNLAEKQVFGNYKEKITENKKFERFWMKVKQGDEEGKSQIQFLSLGSGNDIDSSNNNY